MNDERLLRALLEDRESLVRIAQRVLRCRCDAEDVLQDVALKVCQNDPDETIADPKTYLRRMVRNHAIDCIRRARRNDWAGDADAEARERIAAPCCCPHARMEACEALRAVARTLHAMSPRTRHAFVAHRLGGEPQKSIAVRLRVSPTLVNFLMRDATAQCRAAVEGPAA